MNDDKIYLNEGISALLPVYTQGVGDTTQLFNLKGKDRIIHKKLKTVVKTLTSHYSYDLVALRKKYGKLIMQKHKIPLPLHQDLILVPFKVRYPMVKGDPTYGYINYRCIDKHMQVDKHSKIILTNGIEITLLQSYNTTQRNILNAILVTEHFLKEQFNNTQKLDNLPVLKDELYTPATRGDIILLYEKIHKLLQLLDSMANKILF
jgi:hypothetical protein